MYASKQHFGKHRAAQTMPVIVKVYGQTFAGIVSHIKDNDEPLIITYGAAGTLSFYDVETEHDLGVMPDGTWCWPPPVT
jgi:hypothetical protein